MGKYLSDPAEFDARIAVMRRDLKDLGFHDYRKGTISDETFDEFLDFANKNRRNVSNDALELIGNYPSSFIKKGLKYLPSYVGLGLAYDQLTDNKKDGGKINKDYIMQLGGRAPIIVHDPNDKRLKAYEDSLLTYNDYSQRIKDYIQICQLNQ